MLSNAGRITFSEDEDYKCKPFGFGDTFSGTSGGIHVQMRLMLGAYQAAVSWIESISAQG